MSQPTQEELDEMSLEDLEKHLDEEEGKEPEVEEEGTSESDDTAEEESEAVETEEESEIIAEEDAEETEKVDSEESDFTRGKSREEVIELYERGNQNQSRQNNEINSMKAQIQQLLDAQAKAVQTQTHTSPDVEDTSGYYTDDDEKAIKAIIRKEIKHKDEHEKQIRREEAERNSKENNYVWTSFKKKLQVLNPDSVETMESDIVGEIERLGNAQTIQKQGWIDQYIDSKLSGIQSNGKSTKSTSSESVKKRKVKAGTVGSGGVKTTESTSLKGKPEPSDPDEYVKWLAQNTGEKI